MPKTLILLFILLPFSCLAQFSISGKLLNRDDKKPVSHASVYINNTTSNGESAANGTFTLNNLRNGKYSLIISIVGFETFSETVLIQNSNVKLENIYLTPKENMMKEVVIKPDPNRTLYLTMFKEQFLGTSELAQDCKILNTDLLTFDFDASTNTLTASSDDFLDIENAALGYKIKYKLDNFTYVKSDTAPELKYEGTDVFEQLNGTPSEQRRWLKARQEVYMNSAMHFYRALITDRVDEEGFKVQEYGTFPNTNRPADSVIHDNIEYYGKRNGDNVNMSNSYHYWLRELKLPKFFKELRPYAMEQQDLLQTTNIPGIYAMGCDSERLYVTYNKDRHFDKNAKLQHIYNPHNVETTLMTFNKVFAFLDRNGVLTNPYEVSYIGVWANQRVAELLPIDYDVPQIEGPTADSTVTKNIIAKLEKYLPNHIVEKAYLHFDRPYYAAGDTMYFKAYLTMGDKHEPSQLSGVLHVDLVNSHYNIDQSIALQVNDGVAWGDIVLPDSLPKGNYRVRAYTQWMRNDNETHFFDKVIPVEAVQNSKTLIKSNKTPIVTGKPDIQFFPEGGSLVAGVRSKVAFKAIGADGFGINVKGEVVDNDNKQICSFSPTHLGMGYFYLVPEEGKTYKAKMTYPNGTQDVIDLPAADAKGIVLSVNNDSTLKVSISINSSQSYYRANKNKDHTLIIYSGGTVTSIICKLDSMVIPVNIFKRELHSGIARITLFSPSGEPLSERLVFIQNYDQLKLTISTDKLDYTPKGKVNLKLNAVNSDGEPVSGHFSVSVTDENKVPVDQNSENTIINNLLLTSELKGYVEQPNYYFASLAPEALRNLDILMLTQGYRGFEWKQVFDDKTPEMAWHPQSSLELSGTVKTLSGKPVANGTITLLSTKKNLAKDTTTDANGNFKFTGLYITDTTKLVLHAITQKNNDHVKIEINKPDYPAVTTTNSPDTSINIITPEIAAEMKKRYEQQGSMRTGFMLKQVNINSTKEDIWHPHLTHSDNLNGPGAADQVIMGDKLVGCPDLINCLVSLIHGARFQYPGPTIYSIRTPIELIGQTPPMVVILNGIISDQSVLSTINYNDIYSIEILESHSFLSIYGSVASGGAIVITTKRGGEGSSVSADGSVYYIFNGFQKARTFYSPKYEATTTANNHPDERTTIYWQPELQTGNDGNAGVDFFNSDGTGTYRVVVEGIDANGNIGRYVYHYKVK